MHNFTPLDNTLYRQNFITILLDFIEAYLLKILYTFAFSNFSHSNFRNVYPKSKLQNEIDN